MFGLGAGELLVIFIFALLFIGPKKLPELAKSLGKGIREFQRAKDDIMDHVNNPPAEDKKTESVETTFTPNKPDIVDVGFEAKVAESKVAESSTESKTIN